MRITYRVIYFYHIEILTYFKKPSIVSNLLVNLVPKHKTLCSRIWTDTLFLKTILDII